MGEVDVEVGRAGAVGVQEAFKIQVQFDGVDIGDAQTIGDDGVGAASAADMVKPAALGIADHVPGNEVVGGETHLVDDVQLFLEAFTGFPVVAVAKAEPFPGKFLEQYPVVFAAGAVKLFVLILTEGHVDGTGVDEATGIGDDRRVSAKSGEDVRLRDEIFICPGNVLRDQFGKQGVPVDRAEEAVKVVIDLVLERNRLADDPFSGGLVDGGTEEAARLHGAGRRSVRCPAGSPGDLDPKG